VFLHLGRAAKEKKVGIAFFLDEIQFVKQHEFRALISALHRATQKQLPVTLAAAGLPQIPRLAGEARSYAERLFRFPHIGALDEPAARAALVLPAEREGATYDEAAVERTLELTQGYPFYLQEHGKHIWNIAPAAPISQRDVDTAAPRAEEALDRGIYEVRIRRATIKERRYLRAMAELGPGPTRSVRWPARWAAQPQRYPQCDRNSSIGVSSTPPRTTATSTSRSRASMSSCVATCPSSQRPPDPRSRAVGGVRNPRVRIGRQGTIRASARRRHTWCPRLRRFVGARAKMPVRQRNGRCPRHVWQPSDHPVWPSREVGLCDKASRRVPPALSALV
jgi:hypothetical protein